MHFLSSALLSGGSIIDLDVTFFVQMAVFFVAFIILRSLIFKPAITLFEERELRIDGARREAKELEQEAEDKGETFDAEMTKLRLSAGEERDALRAEGKHLEATVLESVRADTQKQLDEAEVKLQSEAAKVRKEMEASVPLLARQIATKLLSREVN